jgi:ubiquinone/menaquinone biosynthesis C-methylase UbiE
MAFSSSAVSGSVSKGVPVVVEWADDNPARRAASTYGSAADHYERPSLAFWDRFGAETIARLALEPGQTVLDLCCGAGASAIPAARAVAPDGGVIGVDVAEPMLALSRAKAIREGTPNTDFRLADATRTELPSASFDAVVCVFGIFFVPDPAGLASEMWRMVKPAGVLAVTTWGVDLFEPGNTLLWEAVRAIRPDLVRAFHPWDDLTSVEAVTEVLTRAGIDRPRVEYQPGTQELDGPDEFWDIVMGSGYRATVDALNPEQQARLRADVVGALRTANVSSVRTDVVFATAVKPSAADVG